MHTAQPDQSSPVLLEVSDLADIERVHCAKHGIDERDYLLARAKFPTERLARALQDDDNVVELAQRFEVLLLESAEDVAESLARIAAQIDSGFGSRTSSSIDGVIGDLAEAVYALALAHHEEPTVSGQLVEVLASALLKRDGRAARRALEGIARHFGLKLPAPAQQLARTSAATGAASTRSKGFAAMVQRDVNLARLAVRGQKNGDRS